MMVNLDCYNHIYKNGNDYYNDYSDDRASVSLFNTAVRRDSGAIFDGLFDSNSNPQNLYHDYIRQINRTEIEFEELSRKQEALILAACKCMNESILSRVNSRYVAKIQKDFNDYGFNGKSVKEFLKLVKETFFNIKQEEGWAKKIECIFLNSGNEFMYNGEYKCFSPSIALEFLDKSTKKHFILGIPIVDNCRFNEKNYDDRLLGRYVLNADIIRDLKVNEFVAEIREQDKTVHFDHRGGEGEPIKDDKGNFKIKEKQVCIAAEWKAADIAFKIMEFITSNKLDDKRISNEKYYYRNSF